MTDTKEKIKGWDELRCWGDMAKLTKLTRKSRSSLYRVFNSGLCNDPMVLAKLAIFYKKRKAELEQAYKDLDQD